MDQDSHVVACDKETFPSGAMSRKRAAADAEDDVSASSVPLACHAARRQFTCRGAAAYANRTPCLTCVLQAGSATELAAPAVKGGGSTKSDAPAKKKQKPSAYNNFMAVQLPLYKAANPSNNHNDNFAAVAQMWKTHPSNPKNAGAASAEGLPSLAGSAESPAESPAEEPPSLAGSAESLVPPAEKKKKKKKKKSACFLRGARITLFL